MVLLCSSASELFHLNALEIIAIGCMTLLTIHDSRHSPEFSNIQINYHLRGLIEIAFSFLQSRVCTQNEREKMFVAVFKMLQDDDDDDDVRRRLSTSIWFENRFTVQQHLFNALHTLIKSNHINNGDVTAISSFASHPNPHAHSIYMTFN